MYSRNDFIERFRHLDNGVLLDRLAHQELTNEAKEALLQVLDERGVHRSTLDKSVAHAEKVTGRRQSVSNCCDLCGKSLRRKGYVSSESGKRFCSDECRESDYFLEAAGDIPHNEILKATHEIWNGPCPRCKRNRSKVDFRTHYWVYSVVILTSWGRNAEMCCRHCGIQANLQWMAYCLLLDWWGIPFGVLITPVKVLQNVGQMLKTDHQPSPRLRGVARLQLAREIVKGRISAVPLITQAKSPP
jgi:hypothetical protein